MKRTALTTIFSLNTILKCTRSAQPTAFHHTEKFIGMKQLSSFYMMRERKLKVLHWHIVVNNKLLRIKVQKKNNASKQNKKINMWKKGDSSNDKKKYCWKKKFHF